MLVGALCLFDVTHVMTSLFTSLFHFCGPGLTHTPIVAWGLVGLPQPCWDHTQKCVRSKVQICELIHAR